MLELTREEIMAGIKMAEGYEKMEKEREKSRPDCERKTYAISRGLDTEAILYGL